MMKITAAMRPKAMSVGCAQYQVMARRIAPATASGIAQRGSRGLSSSAMKPSSTRCPINIVYGSRAGPTTGDLRRPLGGRGGLLQERDLLPGVFGGVGDVHAPRPGRRAAAQETVDPGLRQVGDEPGPLLLDRAGGFEEREVGVQLAHVEREGVRDDLRGALEPVPAEVVGGVDEHRLELVLVETRVPAAPLLARAPPGLDPAAMGAAAPELACTARHRSAPHTIRWTRSLMATPR